MALITDPDLLNQGTEVVINTTLKTIQLVVTGNLSSDGVTLKAVYSFLKEEWRLDAALLKFDFPMTPITDEQMQIGVSSRNNGWNWADATTRELIRTGGWQEVDGSGVVQAEYAGVVSLGVLETGTQVYFQQASAGASADFVLVGPVNQAVKIFQNATFDYRSYLKVFAREQGDLYASSDLGAIGVTTMTYQVYRFPLTTSPDIKITVADIGIDADSNDIADVAPYTGMSITYFAAPQSRTIGVSSYNFGVIIDGNNGTAEQIYMYVQWALRRAIDIDDGAGTVIGKTADTLLRFVGDTLESLVTSNPAGGGTGVYVDNFLTADINRITFKDNTGATRTFPYTAALALNFSQTLQDDVASVYTVYFTNDDAGDNTGRDFATANAIIPRTNLSFDTTLRERTANIATVTTSTAHGLAIGDYVEIVGMGGTAYNGVFRVLSVPTTTSLTYASAGTTDTSTADTGGVVWQLMAGLVAGLPSKQLGYDYDTNDQRGALSAGIDAPITVVAIGLSGAQYVLATGTIQRSTANVVALVAPLERNYANA